MPMMTLTDKDMHVIESALRTAADTYMNCMRKMQDERMDRLAEQFKRQADEATALADKIEDHRAG
jgi:hypothetical protein